MVATAVASRTLHRAAPVLLAILAVLGLAGCAGGLGGGEIAASQKNEAEEKAARTAKLMQAGPLGDKTMGKPDAPVVIVEYASLNCPFASAFHRQVFPLLKKTYIDTGKVFLIYREFPIGRSSATAALAARCAPEQHYFRLQEKFLATQAQWVGQEVKHDAIYNVVKDTGMSRAAFDSCIANQDVTNGLIWVKQRGRELGVSATPYLFINGEPRRGAISFDELKAIIDPLLAPAPGRQA